MINRCPITETGKPDVGPPVTVEYRNYRGDVATRRISPVGLWYGNTDWHPKLGWLLHFIATIGARTTGATIRWRTAILGSSHEPHEHSPEGRAHDQPTRRGNGQRHHPGAVDGVLVGVFSADAG